MVLRGYISFSENWYQATPTDELEGYPGNSELYSMGVPIVPRYRRRALTLQGAGRSHQRELKALP